MNEEGGARDRTKPPLGDPPRDGPTWVEAGASGYNDPVALADLYRARFGAQEHATASRARETTWRVLCDEWFPQFITRGDTVLELGAGHGEFINNVRAGRKLAVDLNADTSDFLEASVEFHQTNVVSLDTIPSDSIDVVFSSNLMEHLGDADTLVATLCEARRVLRSGGTIISLVPNAKYVGMAFYDFLDHTLPLTDKSFDEALTIAGFQSEVMIPRFLPYTAQNLSWAPPPAGIRAYLKCRPAWRLLGKQFFSVARVP